MKLRTLDTPLSQNGHAKKFAEAKPFPVLIIDNFLPIEVAEGIIEEINYYDNFKKSRDYIFAKNKFEYPEIENLGLWSASLKEMLLSQDMAEILTSIYGKPVFVDPAFIGGGLHRGGDGSYLDMHADFGRHPTQERWVRELNILLYLNKNWSKDFGGSLDLRHATTGECLSIEPLFNRLVIMLTKDFTLHGYKPIKFPTGTFRTSIAAYAYSEASSTEKIDNYRTTTTWVPEHGGLFKMLVAKFTPLLVSYKQRFMGSKTAKRK